MVNKNGFCSNCRTWHRPDRRYWNDCPNPWVPLKRAPQPTIEEQSAAAIREIELKAIREHAARRLDAERRDWERTLERSKVSEMLKHVHQRKSADLAAKVNEVTTELEAARAWRRLQVKAARVDRAVETRAQQQQADIRARGEALNRTLASQERGARARAGAMPLAERLPAELRGRLVRLARREERS
jgi:hypothetical protein